jgi:hypothetical protein
MANVERTRYTARFLKQRGANNRNADMLLLSTSRKRLRLTRLKKS